MEEMFASNRVFKYSVLELIELIRMRPVIWDSSRVDFRSFSSKEKAWREIYEALDGKYRTSDERTQAEIGMRITSKWRNIRDAFMRSCKKRANQNKVKKYMYHDQLAFMLKLFGPEEPSLRRESRNSEHASEMAFEPGPFLYEVNDDFSEAEIKLEQDDEYTAAEYSDPVTAMLKVELEDETSSTCHEKKRKVTEGGDNATSNKVRKRDPVLGNTEDREDIQRSSNFGEVCTSLRRDVTTDAAPTNSTRDEDESFFHSILSLVKDMDGDEKLEFRMGVLRLIHDSRLRKRIALSKKA